jgi:hypothetical protein
MSVQVRSRLNPGVLFLTVVAAVAGWPGPPAHLQTPPPAAPAQKPQVFRAGADVVPVYATVRDPDRGFVLDLTQDDFELLDEGRRQTITQFTIAAQPLSAVVMIDGSGSMMAEFNRAIEGARNFVVRMLPEDRGRIGSFADRVVIGPRFTSDRDALLKYLDDQFNLRVGGETHLWEGVLEAVMSLGEESGKRVVIVMSDGYNFVVPPECKQSQSGGSSSGYPPVGGRGPASPPIGVGGRNPAGGVALPGPPPVGRPGSTGPINGAPPPMTMGCFADPTTYGVTTGQVDAAASARNVVVYGLSMWTRQGITTERPSRHLERVSLDTGGAFYEVGINDDMNRLFTDVVQQLRQQYVLGFVPASFDGTRHSLTVRVKRPGLQVQARRFYVAERTK